MLSPEQAAHDEALHAPDDDDATLLAPGALDGAMAMFGMPAVTVETAPAESVPTEAAPAEAAPIAAAAGPVGVAQPDTPALTEQQIAQVAQVTAQVLQAQARNEALATLRSDAVPLERARPEAPGPTLTTSTPVPGAVAAPQSAPLPAGEIKRDVFSNQAELIGTGQGYTNTVQIDTTTFYIVEAKPEIEANYRKQLKAVEREGKALVKLGAELEKLQEAGELNEADFEARRQELETREQSIYTAAANALNYLIEHTVRGWSDPTWPRTPPCNTETRKALAPAVKAELCAFIQQATKVSGSEAGFLSPC